MSNAYMAFYKEKAWVVRGDTQLEARDAAYDTVCKENPRRKIQPWDVAVMLAERDGEAVTHDTAQF